MAEDDEALLSAHAELDALLDERNDASSEARAAIDGLIRRRFGARRAILISDCAGFSRLTQAEGILHFLGLVRRMRLACVRIVASHGGHTVKTEADNLYASFERPEEALRAAIAIQDFCADEESRAPRDRVAMSIGLGWGDILDLDGEEFYGNQVNLASKLGEDIAEAAEVLATAEFVEAVADVKGWFWAEHHTRISNIGIAYLKLLRVR